MRHVFHAVSLAVASVGVGCPQSGFRTHEEVDLAVSISGDGSGTVTFDPLGEVCRGAAAAGPCMRYRSGSRVVLGALPDPETEVAEWSGACSGSGTCALEVRAAPAPEVSVVFRRRGELLRRDRVLAVRRLAGTAAGASPSLTLEGEAGALPAGWRLELRADGVPLGRTEPAGSDGRFAASVLEWTDTTSISARILDRQEIDRGTIDLARFRTIFRVGSSPISAWWSPRIEPALPLGDGPGAALTPGEILSLETGDSPLERSTEAVWVRRSPGEVSPPPRRDAASARDAARGRVVLFGGSDRSGNRDDVWEWDGARWSEVATISAPEPRSGHGMAYDSARGRVILFGGRGDGVLLDDTWEWDGSSWIEASPRERPSPRVGHAIAYDPARRAVVLFGGETAAGLSGETWWWDGETWALDHAAGAPPPRAVHVLVCPGVIGCVLFGGRGSGGVLFSDTWILRDGPWTIESSSGPSARSDAAAGAADGAAIVSGGWDGAAALGEVWAFDGVWRALDSGPARAGAAAAWHASTGELVVFGGEGASGLSGDTVLHNLTSAVVVGPEPPPRHAHGIAYGSAHGGVLVFGGSGVAGPLGDTWIWDGRAWAQWDGTPAPPPRYGASIAVDRATSRVFLVNGCGSPGSPIACSASSAWGAGDAWVWDGAGWNELAPPGALSSESGAYFDATRSELVLFLGWFERGALPVMSAWDGIGWSDISIVGPPPPCRVSAVAHDVSRNRAMFLAGWNGRENLSETWILGSRTAIDPAPSAPPTPRLQQAMTHDEARDRVVMFGGQIDGAWTDELWEYVVAENRWVERAVAGGDQPGARAGAGIAYDARRDRSVLFGGEDGGRGRLGDTWELEAGNGERPAMIFRLELSKAGFGPDRLRAVQALARAGGTASTRGGGPGAELSFWSARLGSWEQGGANGSSAADLLEAQVQGDRARDLVRVRDADIHLRIAPLGTQHPIDGPAILRLEALDIVVDHDR